MTATHITREQWLQHAATVIRAETPTVAIPQVKISCSWPGGGSARKRIGECWPRKASEAGMNELFVSPKLADPAIVVSTLAHELAHAVDDCEHGHGAAFTKIGRAMRLTGKATQMAYEPAEAARMAALVIAAAGAFPHRKLNANLSGRKKQSTRMIKCECGDCAAVWRMARTHVEACEHGMFCPVCGGTHTKVEGAKE